MKATFTKTHAKGYRVVVEGPAIEAVMDPAPGYHERLPHDAAHFIVENELGITGGVFGQLAAGGTGGTFRFGKDPRKARKTRKLGAAIAKANKSDALFSEHAIYAAQSRWEGHDIIPDTKIPEADIRRICERFEEFARTWSALPVGGSISLDWTPAKRPRNR